MPYLWNPATGQYELVAEVATINVTPEVEESVDSHDDCLCDGCLLTQRATGVKIKSKRVQGYSAKPVGGWQKRAVLGDDDKYMLGVELETDNTTDPYGSRRRGRRSRWYTAQGVSNEWGAGMSKPKDFWLPKHDGSVSGPEFASHPATLAWWTSHRHDMEDMFKMLVHAGFRSHDGGNAGMHVNIGKDAFRDNRHLARFMYLTNIDPRWSRTMAQRTETQTSMWSNFLYGDILHDMYELNNLAQTMMNGWYAVAKYSCVNSPEGQERIEFRLPRGTLRVDRFFKNLQWTRGMVEYTRQLRATVNAVPKKFMKWVEDNHTLYPDLDRFMVEKRAALLTGGN